MSTTSQAVRNLTISGMSCAHCVARVTRALSATPGITVLNVRVGSATLTAASDAALHQAIASLADLGYTAAPQSTT